jgi:hypothetical protein
VIVNYRKRPVVIQAIQWTGDNIHEIWNAFGATDVYGPTDMNPDQLIISTLEGKVRASVEDWIIRGVKGELYPCKPDIFEATYEPVDALSIPPEELSVMR